ncbi:MAG TPA: VWA domain-containing protein [Pyrinomonadaceae bacterium]|nr:VWA domain-containing protein [Pyrinomonadaceae bacterium]
MERRNFLAVILITQLAAVSFGQQPRTPITEPPPPRQPPATQQQKPEDIDVVRITTNLVQVDAVVTDKNGKVVTDLKPEEVQIFEDGKPQKITHFSYNVSETPVVERPAKPAPADKNAPPVPPVALKPEQVRRTMAIVVDDLGLSFESTYFVRRALKKFVDEQMQPGDLVAIVRTSGGMGALQQFTSDKRQLYASIERVKWYASGRGGVGAFAPIQPPTPGQFGPEIDAKNEELNQFREDLFAVGTLGAISYVVKGLRQLPGRKSVLLISDGFRIYSQDDAMRNYLARQRLNTLIDEAGRASVVIYTMNATGLQTLGFSAADDLSNPGDPTGGRSPQDLEQQLSNRRNAAFETQQGLDFLAQQTGGIAIRNTNDLSGGIRRVMEDQKGYYLIGYRPDNATFDPKTGRRTFHKLSLKVTRPGKFNVRMRNGFLGVSDEGARPAPRTLAQQLVAALTSPFGANGVHLQLTSLFGNDAKAGSFMRSLLHIDARDLTFTDEPNNWHMCVFDVLAITFGDNGVPVDQNGRTYTLKLPDELYKRAMRDGLVYYVTVPIKKPGAYQLRMSLRDTSSERIGAASQFIEAPDLKKDRLALSGIVIRGENSAAKKTSPNAPAGQASANKPGTVNSAPGQTQEGLEQGNPEASPAVRHFGRGMLMVYAFVIYNAHLDKATNAPQLTTQVRLFRDGKPVFTGKENPFKVANPSDLKRLLAGGAIQLGTDLPPGEYVFQVIVNDPLASEKHRIATQWIDFEIVK